LFFDERSSKAAAGIFLWKEGMVSFQGSQDSHVWLRRKENCLGVPCELDEKLLFVCFDFNKIGMVMMISVLIFLPLHQCVSRQGTD
jgi:hypothetical protein